MCSTQHDVVAATVVVVMVVAAAASQSTFWIGSGPAVAAPPAAAAMCLANSSYEAPRAASPSCPEAVAAAASMICPYNPSGADPMSPSGADLDFDSTSLMSLCADSI